jgi:ribosomal protein L11 methyltransferase
MPYRIDIHAAPAGTLERLIDLGALDVEASPGGGVAALVPDNVAPREVASALGTDAIVASPAIGRDAGSVWILSPRPARAGRIRILPAHAAPEPGALRLLDSPAFGTGLHPTTALCLEALDEEVQHEGTGAVLDVGTGSGILALGALLLGVPHATAIDLEAEALRDAAANARLNGLDARLHLVHGSADAVEGVWPLVLANVLAAPLIEMAPALVRRVGHRGRVVLSGIPSSLEAEVRQAYRHRGMHDLRVTSRAGWIALVMQASW